MTPILTAFKHSPDRGQGLARDMRVRWALEELGLAYDVHLLSFEEMKQPAHLERHPFGQIPTYEGGNVVLFESGAILLHLAEQHPGLLPAETDARMRAITWMFAALNTVEPPIVERSMAWVLEREQPWYAQRLVMLDERVRRRLSQLSARLGDAPWLDGDFSAGDLLMVSVLLRLQSSGIVGEYPTLAAYVDRATATLTARPRGRPTSAPSPRSWRCSRTRSSTPRSVAPRHAWRSPSIGIATRQSAAIRVPPDLRKQQPLDQWMSSATMPSPCRVNACFSTTGLPGNVPLTCADTMWRPSCTCSCRGTT